MVLLHRERGHFIFSCFRPVRLLPSSFLSLPVLEYAFVISADPIDDTGWTGWLYRCHCGHGYPNVLRALRPHVMVVVLRVTTRLQYVLILETYYA